MTSKPRSAASHATPAPVAPPPITSTSACSLPTARILLPCVACRGGAPRHTPASRGAALAGLEPIEGARDGPLPVPVVLVALLGIHLRLPALVLDPVLAQVL